jgi:hypothetical protein
MKRLARLAFAFGLTATISTSLFAVSGREAALATPFSDVPANHWAYQYIQSLAADGVIDGYPDGKFKGDRPLTRYEMAVVVARVIAKLQENQGPKGPSKEDLDKLQKLIDALKDELDSLGVRVTNLEDSLDALDKRTKFAQSLSMHGVFRPHLTFRQRVEQPSSITNTTGAAVTTYYGAAVPCTPGVGGCAANANPTAVGGIDPFVNAYISTDDTNNPLTNNGSGIQIRQDSRFSLAYAVTDQLTVSLPVHILNYEFGGEFTQDAKFDVEPGIDINIARAGAITNLDFKFGEIDNMTSSRTGLAFRAPQGYNGSVPYEDPLQPNQKGALVKGTVGEGTFGSTDFEVSFTRVDDTRLDTQPGVTDPNTLPFNANTYFYPVVAPQAGFTQTTPAGVVKTDTFNSGSATLGQVFLTNAAVNGSVYISSYNGATFNALGVQTGGPTQPLPGFSFNSAYNDVVFSVPLPAGSVVGISYRNLSETNNTSAQRYMTHARFNQKFKGYAGAEIGVTYNRVFDFSDTQTSGSGATSITNVNASPVSGYGLVSDTVLGIDGQLPLPFTLLGPGTKPTLFGEVADSKYTADYSNQAATGDTAAVVGIKLHIAKADLSVQYQSVGSDYFSGAPLRYYGNAPQLLVNSRLGYLPDFFGFGNNLGINQQFDNQFTTVGLANPNAAGNPNLTFLNPIFNPFKATGPEYYSSFAPNSQGLTAAVSSPVRIGDLNLTAKGSYQSLQEIAPNGGSTSLYGPSFVSSTPLRYTTYSGGVGFQLPVFGQKANLAINATYETLKRLDMTAEQYYPINPGTNQFDSASYTAANAAFPTGGTYGSGSLVSYFPNYVNVRHTVYSANGSLPLTKNVTLNGSYSTQRYGGSYGTTTTQNISERKDYYTGSVTYNIPKTNSSLTFLARRFSYRDDVLSNYNFGQNREDVNFAVRF